MPKKPCAHPGCVKLLDLGETYCAKHAAQEKRERDQLTDGRRRRSRPSVKWYASGAWRGTKGRRTRQLEAHPLCQMCPEHSRQLATVADHVIPHRDDHGRFWFGELQSLCKFCHDSKKQREEKRALRGGGR
ncbi:HNH endonuclease [Ruegeria litorea]|nr:MULTISPECIES: HNH endonuclease [Roseobacteraceae]MBT3142824.1 HNH endonuclease [Falsiruegeria litorea]